MNNKYRHEYKFLVDECDLILLRSRLRSIMKPDSHSKGGAYEIRSVYFDDFKDTALMQNIKGVSPRFKYRIRIYNGDNTFIRLEKKIKKHDMTQKESERLTLEECKRFLKGQYLICENDSDFLKEFKTYATIKGLQPKVIVLYEREVFVCAAGNVRITLDRNIASATETAQFFEKDFLRRPVMPSGRHILEIKYDEFLPSYIKGMLNAGKLDRTTYSKYVMCRKYSNENNRNGGRK